MQFNLMVDYWLVAALSVLAVIFVASGAYIFRFRLYARAGKWLELELEPRSVKKRLRHRRG